METQKSWTKYPVLFCLYLAQSVPMSFFSTLVPVIMRQEHYSLQSIGLLQLVKLPWILKFLWAPLIDKRAGSPQQIRSWILGSEFFYALVILSIGLLNLKTDFIWIVILMVLAFLASATQDIATDIFAIRNLKPEERSWGNSIQSAGSFAGSLLGTGVLLVIYHYLGWTWLVISLACFVLLAIIPFYLTRSRKRIAPEKPAVNLKDIFTFFKDPPRRNHAIMLVFFYSGIIGIMAMVKPWLVDHGFALKKIGFISGILGTSVAILTSLLAGWILRKVGRRRVILLAVCMNMLVAVFFLWLSLISPPITLLYTAVFLVWGAYGFSTVVVYTTSMDKVRLHREGTDFTLQIVITHLSSLIIAVICGSLGDKAGYPAVFALEMFLAVIALAMFFILTPTKTYKNG